MVGDLPLQRQIKSRLAETGLRIFDVEAIWLQPHTDIEQLKPSLDVAVELGARYVLTVGHDPDWGRMTNNLSRLCEAAHVRELRVMLEFIPYSHVRNLQEAHRLLTEAAPANAGLLVDALHLSRSGGSPADIAGYEPELFTYIHLCDAPLAPPQPENLRTEARGGRLYPGEGRLWLPEFLTAFPTGTPIAIEAPSARHNSLSPQDRARLATAACRDLFGKVSWPSALPT